MTDRFDHVFASIPDEIRKRLKQHFHKVMHDHALGRFETSELNGGKFCEAMVRVLEWYATSQGVSVPGKPTTEFEKRIRRIMNCNNLLESFRLNVPDVLLSVYRIRNNRGVAHIAGDVEPNFMDSTYVVAAANWVMSELVRVMHNVSIDQARYMVESLTIKKIPLIWEVDGLKRVLSPPSRPRSAQNKVLIFAL